MCLRQKLPCLAAKWVGCAQAVVNEAEEGWTKGSWRQFWKRTQAVWQTAKLAEHPSRSLRRRRALQLKAGYTSTEYSLLFTAMVWHSCLLCTKHVYKKALKRPQNNHRVCAIHVKSYFMEQPWNFYGVSLYHRVFPCLQTWGLFGFLPFWRSILVLF